MMLACCPDDARYDTQTEVTNSVVYLHSWSNEGASRDFACFVDGKRYPHGRNEFKFIHHPHSYESLIFFRV